MASWSWFCFSTRLKLVGVVCIITWSRADSLLIRSRHLYPSIAWHSVLRSLIKVRAELTRNVCPPLQQTSPLHSGSLCHFTGSIKSSDTKHPPSPARWFVYNGTKSWSPCSMNSEHSRSCVCSVSPPGIPLQPNALPAANAVRKFIRAFRILWVLI
jgi:hypothetical protein